MTPGKSARLTDPHETRWQEFEALGQEEVRKLIGSHLYSEEKERLARQWLDYRESLDSSEVRNQTLAVATEANDLARAAYNAASEANDIARSAVISASRSASAAQIANRIATAAFTAAVVAIAVSIIGLIFKGS